MEKQMSKRNLTDREKNVIQYQQKNCPVVRFLQSKDKLSFSTGDYLIKLNRIYDRWVPEPVSNVSSVPKKFICIHEDQYGIRYIKPLSSTGIELSTIIPITEFNEDSYYTIDPEYADHIILNGENNFNAAAQKKTEKQRRDLITRKNKKNKYTPKKSRISSGLYKS